MENGHVVQDPLPLPGSINEQDRVGCMFAEPGRNQSKTALLLDQLVVMKEQLGLPVEHDGLARLDASWHGQDKDADRVPDTRTD